MCGEIQPWQHTQEIVVRLTTPFTPVQGAQNGVTMVQPSAAHVRVDLGRELQHIREVRLTEYMVHNNGTPAANNVWFVSLAGSNLSEKSTCSTLGVGHAICIADMTNPYHVVYDNPRIVSVESKKSMSILDVKLTTEAGVAPVFNNVTLYFTIVMDIPNWSPALVAQEDKNKIEWWRSNENVGRFRF